MDDIEGQGAVSDDLTPALLAISETGWPLPMKPAAKTREAGGQFRRIQVANSRETGWPKPVKSAGETLRVLAKVFDYVVPVNGIASVAEAIAAYLEGDESKMRWLVRFAVESYHA